MPDTQTELDRLQADLAALRDAMQAQQQAMLDQAARQWACSLIDRNYATPAIQDDLATLHRVIMQRDASLLPTFEAILTSRPPHRITEELVPSFSLHKEL